jgi:hypothetical protein
VTASRYPQEIPEHKERFMRLPRSQPKKDLLDVLQSEHRGRLSKKIILWLAGLEAGFIRPSKTATTSKRTKENSLLNPLALEDSS